MIITYFLNTTLSLVQIWHKYLYSYFFYTYKLMKNNDFLNFFWPPFFLFHPSQYLALYIACITRKPM